MSDDKKSLSRPEWILAGVLAVELLYLVYCNFVHMPDAIDSDTAKMMVHTIEMARHRTFLLRDWLYTTTAEWDTIALPAVVFYWMTGDVCLSYAIMNCLNIAFFVYVVNRLLTQAGLERIYRILSLCVLFGLYDMDNVWYTADMLFTGGAQYFYKVCLPLLLLVILTAPDADRRSKRQIVLSVLLFAMSLITAASSGYYVLLCGFLPIAACYLVMGYALRPGKDTARYVLKVFGTVMAVTVIGMFLCRVWHVHPGSSTEMDLRTLTEVSESPFRTFSTLLQVWNLFPAEPVGVMTLQGIGLVTKFVFISVLLLSGFFALKRSFGVFLFRGNTGQARYDVDGREKEITAEVAVRTCLATIFVWNYIILYLTYSTARYQLIGAIPLEICAVWELRDLLKNRFVPALKRPVICLTAAALGIMAVASVGYSEREHFHERDALTKACVEIRQCMDDLNVNTVIWLNSRVMSEMMRYYDQSGRMYPHIMVSPEGSLQPFNWNTYKSVEDPDRYDERNVIIASKESFSFLKESVRRAYTATGDVFPIYVGNNLHDDYYVYIADTCPIDGFE